MARKILLLDIGEDTQMQLGVGASLIGIGGHGRIITTSGSAATSCAVSKVQRNSGKLYCAALYKVAGGGTGIDFGLSMKLNGATVDTSRPGYNAFSWGVRTGSTGALNSQTWNSGVGTNVAKIAAGQYIHMAADLNTGKIWFGYGPVGAVTWFSGDPAAGTSPSYSNLLPATNSADWGVTGGQYVLSICPNATNATVELVPDFERLKATCPAGFTPWGIAYRCSNEDYVSETGDDPANFYWPARITADPDYQRGTTVYAWNGQNGAAATLDSVTLDNADGELDFLKGYDLRDMPVRARLGYNFQALSLFSDVASTVVENIAIPSELAMQALFRSRDALLDKAFQAKTWPSGMPVAELQDKPKPLAMGNLSWVPLIPVDQPNLEYALTDSPWSYTTQVLDQGVVITSATGYAAGRRADTYGITRTTNPAGKQAAQIIGRARRTLLWQELFTSWSGDNPVGWAIFTGTETAALRFTQALATMRCQSDGSATLGIERTGNLANAAYFFITINVSSYTSGSCVVQHGTQRLALLNKVGTYRIAFRTNTASAIRVIMPGGSTCDLNIDDITVEGCNPVERLPEWITDLCVTQTNDFVDSDLDTGVGGTIYNLDLVTGYTLGVYCDDSSTRIRQILQASLTSYGGGYYWDRLGVLKVGRLTDPAAGSSVLTLDESSIQGRVDVLLDGAPGLSDSWAGRKNYAVHSPTDIAGSVVNTALAAQLQQQFLAVRKTSAVFANTYRHARGAEPTETLLTTDAAVAAEANRFGALYTKARYFYTFNAFLEDAAAYTLEPFQIITLALDRYGFNAGVQLLVVSVRSRFLSNVVQIVAWG